MIKSISISRRTLIFCIGGLALAVYLSESSDEVEADSEAVLIAPPTLTSPVENGVTTTEWPRWEVEQTAAYNPFTWNGRDSTPVIALESTDKIGLAEAAMERPNQSFGMIDQNAFTDKHRARIILKSPTGDAVMIGDRVLSHGDSVDGMTVTHIGLDEVIYATATVPADK